MSLRRPVATRCTPPPVASRFAHVLAVGAGRGTQNLLDELEPQVEVGHLVILPKDVVGLLRADLTDSDSNNSDEDDESSSEADDDFKKMADAEWETRTWMGKPAFREIYHKDGNKYYIEVNYHDMKTYVYTEIRANRRRTKFAHERLHSPRHIQYENVLEVQNEIDSAKRIIDAFLESRAVP